MFRQAFSGVLMPLAACVSLGLALAGCQSGSPAGVPSVSPLTSGSKRASPAATSKNLYVAIVTAGPRLAIDRYRLHNGIPTSPYNRVYQGYGGLIAVAGDGTLYSTLGESPNVIDVFSPGSNTPAREIDVSPDCGPSSFTVINAIAADRNGYLFVLIYSYPGAKRSYEARSARAGPDARTPCNGIAVYAPNANGRAHPVQRIRLSDVAEADGLAVDVNDNLYVAENYPSVVKEYSNAVADPKRTRTFRGKYLGGIRSLAVGSAGDLFIASAEQSYTMGWINRYSPAAKGTGPPTSAIHLQGSGPHLLYSIAVQGRYLYADDTQQFAQPQSVDVYYARKNGTQSPLYSLSEPKVDSVAVGP